MSFKSTEKRYVTIWRGDPDCQAAHDWILERLRSLDQAFLTASDSYTVPIKGNLGESITFCIGHAHHYSDWRCFAPNAFNPFTGISKPEIDIIWLRFGESIDQDIAVLQEVKVTGQESPDYARKLVSDYEKLFGSKSSETLRARLRAIKTEFRYTIKRPDLGRRLDYLAGDSPGSSPKIRLLPTLLHDLAAGDAEAEMMAVRATICGNWAPTAVGAWVIGLSDLNERLRRLATGNR